MKSNTPRNPKLLWGSDVDTPMFDCCPNSDRVLVKCPACGHLMAACRECSTLFPNLDDPTQFSFIGTDDKERVVCVACNTPFEDYYFLMQPYMEKCLPTADEVIARGYGHLLSPKLRRERGLS